MAIIKHVCDGHQTWYSTIKFIYYLSVVSRIWYITSASWGKMSFVDNNTAPNWHFPSTTKNCVTRKVCVRNKIKGTAFSHVHGYVAGDITRGTIQCNWMTTGETRRERESECTHMEIAQFSAYWTIWIRRIHRQFIETNDVLRVSAIDAGWMYRHYSHTLQIHFMHGKKYCIFFFKRFFPIHRSRRRRRRSRNNKI